MLPGTHSLLKRDRARTSALVGGLAGTVAAWTLAAAFASERLGSLSSYLLVARGRDRMTPLDLHEGYRCPEHSLCANQNEKIRLAAVTASFALTITAWVGALSFMPEDWIDWLGNSPVWICCVASMVLWSTLSAAMLLAFRDSSERDRGEPPLR